MRRTAAGKQAMSDFNARPETEKLTRSQRNKRAQDRAAAMRAISDRWAAEEAQRKALLNSNDPALRESGYMLRECYHDNEDWLTEGMEKTDA